MDDINEFESELEAPDKWKRRFRLMKQDDGASSGKGPEASASDASSAEVSDEEKGTKGGDATGGEGDGTPVQSALAKRPSKNSAAGRHQVSVSGASGLR